MNSGKLLSFAELTPCSLSLNGGLISHLKVVSEANLSKFAITTGTIKGSFFIPQASLKIPSLNGPGESSVE